MHLVMIGGSDAGISAALRARELDPGAEVSVVVADAYPNFSICGIPYYVSGEVTHWRTTFRPPVPGCTPAGKAQNRQGSSGNAGSFRTPLSSWGLSSRAGPCRANGYLPCPVSHLTGSAPGGGRGARCRRPYSGW